MQLKELHQFKLSDAVHFHDELNPAVFNGDHMKPEVREQLLLIAKDFVEHLGIDDLNIEDITLSGSSAAFSYTKYSDIDLHIVVDMNKFNDDDVYREFFDAKKTVYNEVHNIVIDGYEVELYVQDSNQPVISLGEYSVMNDKWIKLPRKRKAHFDQAGTKLKYDKLAKLADYGIRSNNIEKLRTVIKNLKKYRQSGLEEHGEFGPENLAYKVLRNQGVIKKIYDTLDKLHSQKLSLPESKVLDKPELSVTQLAKKHNVDKMHIMDQLVKGIGVESEHTSDEKIAREIALDHLAEDPNYYTKLDKAELDECSGYIPSEKEKNDPRWERALSVDVHPDTMQKGAKKFGWNISRAGIPPLLRK